MSEFWNIALKAGRLDKVIKPHVNGVTYQDYLNSKQWKMRRDCALIFWHYKCAICYSAENVEVHHRTYEHVGEEPLNDLIVLCRDCHQLFHDHQKKQK